MEWRSLGSLRRLVRWKSSCCSDAGTSAGATAGATAAARLRLLRLLVFFLAGGGKRLRTLGIVAIDGHGLQPELPRFDVGLHDVFDRGFLGHVDGLADGAGKERLRRRHHSAGGRARRSSAAAHRRERAIENRQVLGLETGRAFDFAGAVDVGNDLGDVSSGE